MWFGFEIIWGYIFLVFGFVVGFICIVDDVGSTFGLVWYNFFGLWFRDYMKDVILV